MNLGASPFGSLCLWSAARMFQQGLWLKSADAMKKGDREVPFMSS
jgi:hypothetical protein